MVSLAWSLHINSEASELLAQSYPDWQSTQPPTLSRMVNKVKVGEYQQQMYVVYTHSMVSLVWSLYISAVASELLPLLLSLASAANR